MTMLLNSGLRRLQVLGGDFDYGFFASCTCRLPPLRGKVCPFRVGEAPKKRTCLKLLSSSLAWLGLLLPRSPHGSVVFESAVPVLIEDGLRRTSGKDRCLVSIAPRVGQPRHPWCDERSLARRRFLPVHWRYCVPGRGLAAPGFRVLFREKAAELVVLDIGLSPLDEMMGPRSSKMASDMLAGKPVRSVVVGSAVGSLPRFSPHTRAVVGFQSDLPCHD